jgi:hypothetical protein
MMVSQLSTNSKINSQPDAGVTSTHENSRNNISAQDQASIDAVEKQAAQIVSSQQVHFVKKFRTISTQGGTGTAPAKVPQDSQQMNNSKRFRQGTGEHNKMRSSQYDKMRQ